MVAWLWSGAVGLTIAGVLFFWGVRIFAIESLDADSGALLGLALVMVALAQL